MAVRITASVVLRKRTLRAEGLYPHPDSHEHIAQRVSDVLRDALRGLVSSVVTDGIVVTVQEVDKNGEPKGVATQNPRRELQA